MKAEVIAFVGRHPWVTALAPALGFAALVPFEVVDAWQPHGFSMQFVLLAYAVAWGLVAPRGIIIGPMLAAASGLLVLLTPEPDPCLPPPTGEAVWVMTSCEGPWQAYFATYLVVLAIAGLLAAILGLVAVSVRRAWAR